MAGSAAVAAAPTFGECERCHNVYTHSMMGAYLTTCHHCQKTFCRSCLRECDFCVRQKATIYQRSGRVPDAVLYCDSCLDCEHLPSHSHRDLPRAYGRSH